MAEAELPRALVEESLHTTPEAIEAYWKAAFVAASQAGSIGVQGQFANGLAALFLACGQTWPAWPRRRWGNVRLERTDAGDLYASVCLPNLIVGTVGGGTGTPTARECLALLGCDGKGTAPKLAEIAAGLVLAGEISIAAALTSGDSPAPTSRSDGEGSPQRPGQAPARARRTRAHRHAAQMAPQVRRELARR